MRRVILVLLLFFFLQVSLEATIFETTTEISKKSIAKAMGLSLLLPGLGEYYLGDIKTAFTFFAVEAGIWTTTSYFYARGKWLEEDYKGFAVSYASINPNGKSDNFFEKLCFYLTRDQYNFETLLMTENKSLLFPETDDYYWQWQSEEYMNEYHRMWTKSKTAYRDARIMLAIAGVNRFISVIDILRIRFFSGWGERFTIILVPQNLNNTSLGLGVRMNF